MTSYFFAFSRSHRRVRQLARSARPVGIFRWTAPSGGHVHGLVSRPVNDQTAAREVGADSVRPKAFSRARPGGMKVSPCGEEDTAETTPVRGT